MTALLCYDGSLDSRLAIESAARLMPGRDALVLHVSKSFVDWSLGPSLGPLLEVPGVDEAILARAEQVLAEGVALAQQAGFIAAGELRTTGRSAWRTILDAASEHDIEVIVAGSHGHRLRDQLGLGSVSRGLVTHASTPLLITHKDDHVAARAPDERLRALLAYDGSEAAQVAAKTACSVLPGASFVVASAWETPSQLGITFMSDATAAQLDGIATTMEREARRIAGDGGDIVRALGSSAGELVLASDDGIGRTLVDAAAEHDADLIIVGTHGHSRLARALLGSTASYIVQHASWPVLVVPMPA